MRSVLNIMGVLVSIFALTACNTNQGEGLITDAKKDVCPPGCADSLKADEGQISIKIANSTVSLASTDTRVDIGGDCYPSLYTSNRIFIAVSDSSGSSYTANYYPLSNSGYVSCLNGKFDAAVDLSNLPARGVFTVQATLVAYDGSVPHTNNSDGVSYVTVRR